MPEGPEVYEFARRINEFLLESSSSRARVLSCSYANGPPAPPLCGLPATMVAESRGKELRIKLSSPSSGDQFILFTHGLVGQWKCSRSALPSPSPKHMCARFMLEGGGEIRFHDSQRMGRWRVVPSNTSWGDSRGPCPLTQHDQFASHVMESLGAKVFAKPISVVLLDQRYFNGIGNYMRSEVMARAGVDPSDTARSVLSGPRGALLLTLCNRVGAEVVERRLHKYGTPEQKTAFSKWLRCYQKAQRSKDASGRTLWAYASPTSPSPEDVACVAKNLSHRVAPSDSSVSFTAPLEPSLPRAHQEAMAPASHDPPHVLAAEFFDSMVRQLPPQICLSVVELLRRHFPRSGAGVPVSELDVRDLTSGLGVLLAPYPSLHARASDVLPALSSITQLSNRPCASAHLALLARVRTECGAHTLSRVVHILRAHTSPAEALDAAHSVLPPHLVSELSAVLTRPRTPMTTSAAMMDAIHRSRHSSTAAARAHPPPRTPMRSPCPRPGALDPIGAILEADGDDVKAAIAQPVCESNLGDVGQMLALLQVMHRYQLLSGEDVSTLKDLALAQPPYHPLNACLEYYRAEDDMEELAHTLKRICCISART